jgi:hypothetical protein
MAGKAKPSRYLFTVAACALAIVCRPFRTPVLKGNQMVLCKNKANLSQARRRLLELFQQVNFGRVENLTVKDGEPLLAPTTRVAREIKFGGDNSPRQELSSGDFLLKSQVVELFKFFDAMQTGTIELIEVKHGLPFRMIVPEATA